MCYYLNVHFQGQRVKRPRQQAYVPRGSATLNCRIHRLLDSTVNVFNPMKKLVTST